MSPNREPSAPSSPPFEDILEALKQTLRKSAADDASRGDAHAQRVLGDYYRDGDGGPQDDTAAVHWYRTAAEQRHAPAECRLGRMYETGRGLGIDLEEAIRWYRRAASQGNADAQFRLGTIYEQGGRAASEDEEAIKWRRYAAAPRKGTCCA